MKSVLLIALLAFSTQLYAQDAIPPVPFSRFGSNPLFQKKVHQDTS